MTATTPPVSPVEEIAAAANHARKIAKTAQADGYEPPWTVVVRGGAPPKLYVETVAGRRIADNYRTALDHVAMWDPAIACLVADLLESEADRATDALYPDEQEGWRCGRCGWMVDTGDSRCTCWDAALALARAINDTKGTPA
jgi:hypothetical protein